MSTFPCIIKSLATLLILVNKFHVTYQQQPLSSPCPTAIKINTNYQYRGSLHFICLQATQDLPVLDVIEYQSRRKLLSRKVDELGTNQLATFVDDEGSLRILLAASSKFNGTSMYSIDRNGVFNPELHTVNTQFVSAMTIWRMSLNWEWQLAIANQATYDLVFSDISIQNNRKPLPEPKPMISVYSWRATYFDSYQLIHLPYDGRVNKLEPININGQELLVVAMESHKYERNLPGQLHQELKVDSLIYKLDFGEGNLKWLQFQTLQTQLALDVKSFTITHKDSSQTDYYIALLGQLARATRRGNVVQVHDRQVVSLSNQSNQNIIGDEYHDDNDEKYGLIIYKYFGDKFLHTHTIDASTATKFDTISYGTGDTYVIIALLSEWSSEINLYLYDGLSLEPIPSPFKKITPPLVNFARRTRTMGHSDLHLFTTSQAPISKVKDSTTKRTIPGGDEVQQLMLVFSTAADSLNPTVEWDDKRRQAEAAATLQQPGTYNDGFVAVSNERKSYLSGSNGRATSPSESTRSIYHLPVEDTINEYLKQTSPTQQDQSHVKRTYSTTGEELFSWCKATISRLLADRFEVTAKQLSALPRINQHQPIELIGDLIIEDDLHVSNLLYAPRIEETWNNQITTLGASPLDYNDTFKQIEQTHRDIDFVKSTVDQILVDDGTDQNIFNPISFDTLLVECFNPDSLDPRLINIPGSGYSCPHVDDIQTTFLNSRDIRGIQEQALLTGRSLTITKEVRFEHLVLRGSTTILHSLNGISIDNIVFKRGPSNLQITGHKVFLKGLYSASHLLVNHWMGLRVDNQNYLTTTGPQRIDANLKFSRVIIDSQSQRFASRIQTINGVDVDLHLSRIALSDDDNIFEVPIEFDELILNGPVKLAANSRVSSVWLDDIWSHAMFKQLHQNITAPMRFAGDVHVSFGGEMRVNGPVNGFFMTPNNVLMSDLPYNFTNPVVFHGDVIANDLWLLKDLNGIQVAPNDDTGHLELAILYNQGNQSFTGTKVLSDVYLGGQSTIYGNINGNLNLTYLYQLSTKFNQPHRFPRVTLTRNNIRIANNTRVHIQSHINGYPTKDLCSLAIQVSNPAFIPFYSRLQFEQPIRFKSLRCANINGFSDLSSYFLTKRGDQRVAGTLRLANGVIFDTRVDIGYSLNNLKIQPLPYAIAKIINETQTKHKILMGDLVVDELIVDQINELKLSNVFITKSDSPQVVRAPMRFNHLDVENVLNVGKNLYTKFFNGLNLTEVFTNTLQYDAPQVIYNLVEVNSLQILPNANLVAASFNGHNLKRLYADSVLIDSTQQILAPKTFVGPVEFTNILSLGTELDGLTSQNLRSSLLLHGDEIIEGDLELDRDVIVKRELEIQSGMINDIDINQFADSMLHESLPEKRGMKVIGNGSVRFKDVLVNNLVVGGTIQGIDLSRDALTKRDNLNGTYNPRIREHQIFNNNKYLIENHYGPGSSFQVSSDYRGKHYLGTCQVHSCLHQPPAAQLMSVYNLPQPISRPLLINRIPNVQVIPFQPIWRPIYAGRPYNQIIIQTRPTFSQPLGFPQPTWKPLVMKNVSNITSSPVVYPLEQSIIEHGRIIQAEAIKQLTIRINKFLSFSFYYEIFQKHPLLGPLLQAVKNPIAAEEASLLLLRATGGFGEPYRRKGQTVAVMAPQPQKGKILFSQSSRILETSNPTAIASTTVKMGLELSHYIFILDSFPENGYEMSSRIMIYLWDQYLGMYSLNGTIYVDGVPIAMKAFTVNYKACVAIANPTVVYGNVTGPPILHCQADYKSAFNLRITLPITRVFDIDVLTLPGNQEIIIASLQRLNTEQIGSLSIDKLDLTRVGVASNIAQRRLVRPLKLLFIRNLAESGIHYQLVVSEGITSNDGATATTRIFALQLMSAYAGGSFANETRFYESQALSDNQFYDMQSVSLDTTNSLLFLQSANSISIYAPTQASGTVLGLHCDTKYALVQRVPTKGANKFLVFNERTNQSNSTSRPLGHFLVLSKDDCEHQQFHTLILRAKFS